MLDNWGPTNRGGTVYYDPKDEVSYWIARSDGHPMVAVPVSLLKALAERKECSARLENPDGLAPYICRLQQNHDLVGISMHYNGFLNWYPEQSVQESPL